MSSTTQGLYGGFFCDLGVTVTQRHFTTIVPIPVGAHLALAYGHKSTYLRVSRQPGCEITRRQFRSDISSNIGVFSFSLGIACYWVCDFSLVHRNYLSDNKKQNSGILCFHLQLR